MLSQLPKWWVKHVVSQLCKIVTKEWKCFKGNVESDTLKEPNHHRATATTCQVKWLWYSVPASRTKKKRVPKPHTEKLETLRINKTSGSMWKLTLVNSCSIRRLLLWAEMRSIQLLSLNVQKIPKQENLSMSLTLKWCAHINMDTGR